MQYFVIISIVISCASCSRILFYTYIPSISHQKVFRSIWKDLSLRGHEVTAVATDPLNDPKLTNLTEIDTSITYDVFKEYDYSNLGREATTPLDMSRIFMKSFVAAIHLQMNTKSMKELMKKPSDYFDLILVEVHAPVAFGIQHKFKAPMIGISSLSSVSPILHFFGNPTHPLIYPDLFSGLSVMGSGLTLWEKFDSVFVTAVMWFQYKFKLMPSMDREARKYFGNDMPYIEDFVRNTSLLMLNINPIFSNRSPNAPNVIEYFNVHMGEGESLSKDLQKILDEAKNGAIYFSLGTNVRLDHVQGNIKNVIMDALGELPYTVLCKWESDDYPGKPKNVVLRKWFPQQSILAHKNVKVFVTQGGLQSSEEAISNGIPVVVIPFLGDQPMNAKILTSHGIAETIPLKLLNKENLKDAILKVAKDQKYRLKAQELRSIFLDQPQSGVEKIYGGANTSSDTKAQSI